MKVIAFPYAGGNQYSFSTFFSKNINIEVVEYPGRGQKSNISAITNIDSLIEVLSFEIFKNILLCNQYVIYGHSMGALIGYLICKEIERLGVKKPLKLIVSGKKAPKFKTEKVFHVLQDNKFLNKVVGLGGIPIEIFNYPEFMDYYIPILKSDFECVEKYEYDSETSKLTIPIDVFYGSEEDITEEEAQAWQEETTGKVTVTKLIGNHFFIFEYKDFFTNYFNQLNATV